MKIGTFTQQENGYTGWINTAGLGLADVKFIPMPAKQGNGPDFVVICAGDGEQFELGAAWAKTSKKDKPYLSVRLDSPALVAPINCALTRQADGTHALVWNRARKDGEQAEEQAQPGADHAQRQGEDRIEHRCLGGAHHLSRQPHGGGENHQEADLQRQRRQPQCHAMHVDSSLAVP